MVERFQNDEKCSERESTSHTRTQPSSRLNQHRRPADGVSSPWPNEKVTYYDDDLADEGSCSRLTRDAVYSRRYRRMLVVLLLALGLSVLLWKWYFRLQDDWDMKEGFMAGGNGTLEIAKVGRFEGTRIEELDARYLPGGKYDAEGQRRLVFVGDIHGCSKELKKLLKEVQFDEERDHLIAVGDVISKGPDDVGVLDELMRLGATSVRGNHEDRILALAPSTLGMESEAEVEAESSGAKKDRKLLKHLHKKHLKYLRSLPLMLRIPALPLAAKLTHKNKSPLAEEILVVHAGLVPGVALEDQDPYFVMNMRAIRVKNHLPLTEASDKHGKTKPWHNVWSWYNDRLFRKKSIKNFQIWDTLEDETLTGWDSWLGLLGLKSRKKWPAPQVVVYGHHSKAGLQVDRWSKGLDTGCVRGGELTAMVLDARGNWNLSSIDCKDHR